MTIDEKWEAVKAYYEPAYKVMFKYRLDDKDIDFLYANMVKLSKSVRDIYDRARPALLDLIQANPSS